MHILYIHQHFATPKGSTGTRSYEFARRWVKAGHKVTLITGYYDIGGLPAGKKLYRKLNIEGINIIVAGTRYGNKQSYIRRIVSFGSFCLLSIYAGLRTKDVDVIYATSTPLTVGIPAIILKWLKRVPFVFEVRDQWPEIPIDLGIIKNKVMIKFLLWLEKTIYKYSSAIVALSAGMAEGIKNALTTQKPIEVIPNSCDIDVFRPDIDGSQIRQKYGWADKLVLLHFGAMGKANGLDFVIDAAERFKDNPDIHFVLAGDGSRKKSLAKKIERLRLNNVEILDSMPKSELAELVAACDVAMVIFANYPILEHNSANKFFDSLSAGKPVLLNYSGWQRKILEENHAGFGCQLCNLDEFAKKVSYLNSHRDQLLQMGQNARRIAAESFDRDKLAAQALFVLSRVSCVVRDVSCSMQYEIIKAGPEHVSGMADCHIAAFDGQFMTEMGFRWLYALYRFFIEHPEGVCYAAVDSACKVVGLAAGGEPDIRDRFLRFSMLRYPHILLWKFVTRSLVRKVLLEELFKRLHLKPAAISKDSYRENKAGNKCGSLLSICVLPDWMGTGIADRLIEAFQRDCAAKGYRHLKLSVVSGNSRAIAFYKKHGWYETENIRNSVRFALDL